MEHSMDDIRIEATVKLHNNTKLAGFASVVITNDYGFEICLNNIKLWRNHNGIRIVFPDNGSYEKDGQIYRRYSYKFNFSTYTMICSKIEREYMKEEERAVTEQD